jgi:hypothetical protein
MEIKNLTKKDKKRKIIYTYSKVKKGQNEFEKSGDYYTEICEK